MMVAVVETRPVTLADELQEIAEASYGFLISDQVVSWAQAHPESKLYERFEWDDTEAAHGYRLWQARHLIGRVKVRVQAGPRGLVRAYVSMRSDRSQPHGGYRVMASILEDADERQELLRQALAEFRAWRRKYEQVKELAAVFQAADEVVAVAD